MEGIRIIAGSLRGRVIPFLNRRYDQADITPQKVKGAIFSMIGEWLQGRSFLDLYAGSGQIGLEALSRGAEPVVMNESDPARFRFIRNCVEEFGAIDSATVLNLPASRALDQMHEEGRQFDYIFLDPPYRKSEDADDPYRDVIGKAGSLDLLAPGGEIIVQHFSEIAPDETVGCFRARSVKQYGKTSLTVYSQAGAAGVCNGTVKNP
jgi:16S rRNA (guanine966-N2)-methyltransferase